MVEKEPTAERLPATPEHPSPTPWAIARQRLAEGQWFWLATVRPDGRPHVVPLLAVWLDDTLYFAAGPATRKAKNLTQNPHCVITFGADDSHWVVEGKATKVGDDAKLHEVAAVYAAKYGWPVTIRDSAFYADYGAPTAGPPPYELYEVTPTVVFAFGTDESFSPTRWRSPEH